jgi:DNA-binding NtrC family response regulator
MTRQGHIERAAGGTLFLDEISEIPPSVQVKLLRFVEAKALVRVGGREELRVDLRIMAASNQDLNQAVAEKRFREDLLYRLRVLEVKLPPLRERVSDVPALASYLLAGLARDRKLALSVDTLEMLKGHTWPGNVRELRNALEHAAAVCGGNVLLPAHFPEELRNTAACTGDPRPNNLEAALHEWVEARLHDQPSYDALHGELEGKLLATLLPRYEGKPTLLARAMDMNRATLRKKLRGIQGVTEEPEEESC